MEWIKRNLYFLVGGGVALALMGMAGWFLYSKWRLNTETWDRLNQDYSELSTLNNEKPHPGAGKVDNIKLAKEQEAALKDLITKIKARFEPIPPIPAVTNIADRDFSAALNRELAQMQKDATNSSVVIPPKYSFSFEVQRPKLTFAAGSLYPLSVQLGEVRAICDILFKAKVNSLDNIRRERVGTDDASGQLTDYLDKKSVTNELAVISPYEVTFRCFTPELGAVIGGFANASSGLVIKGINVEAAPQPTVEEQPQQPVFAPVYVPAATPADSGGESRSSAAAAAAFQRRYGISPGGGRGANRYATPAQPQQPAYVAPVAVAPATQAKGGLQTVLNEKQLKVTLTIGVVKLGSHQSAPPAEPATAPTDANSTTNDAPVRAPQA
jgi:hypothetical protein